MLSSAQFAIEQRRRTGRIGVRLFIVSETMFFAALFFAWYYLGVTSNSAWPPDGVARPLLAPAVLNTALTLISAVTMWLASRSIGRDDQRGLVFWMAASVVCAVVFMAVQTQEFRELAYIAQGSSYGSLFLFLLFFHAVRVFVGVVLMLIVLVRASMHQLNARRRLLVDATVMYWYFIVAVWLAVFTVLYVL
ncbi:MAG: cytochrome c oxidase subunit 3 [Chloroflexi bacterium]|nr:cytochrome c oxidase subunit 3 [Chloroflexota bacterium]